MEIREIKGSENKYRIIVSGIRDKNMVFIWRYRHQKVRMRVRHQHTLSWGLHDSAGDGKYAEKI